MRNKFKTCIFIKFLKIQNIKICICPRQPFSKLYLSWLIFTKISLNHINISGTWLGISIDGCNSDN